MQTSNYRVVPLPGEVAMAARRSAAAGASDHAIISVTSPNQAPCRHCLRWAQPGEQVVLFPYASIAPGRPYAESGPIFVHAVPCQRYQATDEFPAAFGQGRAFRAYDRQQNMLKPNPNPIGRRNAGRGETSGQVGAWHECKLRYRQ